MDSKLHCLPDGRGNPRNVRVVKRFENQWEGRVRAANARHWSLKPQEATLLDGGGDFGRKARRHRGLERNNEK